MKLVHCYYNLSAIKYYFISESGLSLLESFTNSRVFQGEITQKYFLTAYNNKEKMEYRRLAYKLINYDDL